MLNNDPFRLPNDADIAAIEKKLNFTFPPDYVNFLKTGGNVANARFEAAIVLLGCEHLYLYDIATWAWEHGGVPKDWLPFVEDNGDYFCVSNTGQVRFWSHNGATNEHWTSFSAWYQQVCVGGQ